MTSDQFTFESYRLALKKALRQGFSFSLFNQEPDGKKRIWLRHDVDFSLDRAADLGQLESNLGVSSTYFVMLNNQFYNPFSPPYQKIIYNLKAQGHEIGLHFDRTLLSQSENLESYVSRLLDFIESILPISRVVSFHRPKDRIFGLNNLSFINVYSDIFFNQIEYKSDSKREPPHLEEMMGKYKELQILLHPLWWHEHPRSMPEIYSYLEKHLESHALNWTKDNLVRSVSRKLTKNKGD